MKVEIVVSEGHNYCKSHNNGAEYTSVDYGTNRYGGGSPCDTESDVQDSIKHARDVIKDKGDIPVLRDKRAKNSLLNWIR